MIISARIICYLIVTGYEQGTDYIGGIIGRVANRVAGAQFTIDGSTFNLFKNDGPNSNHGGKEGFNKVRRIQ